MFIVSFTGLADFSSYRETAVLSGVAKPPEELLIVGNPKDYEALISCGATALKTKRAKKPYEFDAKINNLHETLAENENARLAKLAICIDHSVNAAGIVEINDQGVSLNLTPAQAALLVEELAKFKAEESSNAVEYLACMSGQICDKRFDIYFDLLGV